MFYDEIDKYNLFVANNIEKGVRTHKKNFELLENASVKNLFDDYFIDSSGNVIVDENKKTVYDNLPDSAERVCEHLACTLHCHFPTVHNSTSPNNEQVSAPAHSFHPGIGY